MIGSLVVVHNNYKSDNKGFCVGESYPFSFVKNGTIGIITAPATRPDRYYVYFPTINCTDIFVLVDEISLL